MKTSKLTLAVALIAFSTAVFSQDYTVNTVKSTLQWTGKKVTGEHHGYITLKDGKFTIKINKIISGTFTIDMTTIIDVDLTDKEWNDKLVGHLKSDDFFGVEKFPTATLSITESTPFKDNVSNVKGTLTIKGIQQPISFVVTKSGNDYTSTLTVDRTLYGIKYGSGKFFDNLGDKTIYDEFTLDVKIATN
jgi:polyisoprenoid-binding protein YceI